MATAEYALYNKDETKIIINADVMGAGFLNSGSWFGESEAFLGANTDDWLEFGFERRLSFEMPAGKGALFGQLLELSEGDSVLASFPITPGSAKLPAPKGTWKILGVVTLPNFRWDAMMLNHGTRSDTFYMLQPGPNNPVGVAWMGLNKPGIGLHGPNTPDTIGRSASHGCIRLANWDAIRLVGMVTKGIKVTIK